MSVSKKTHRNQACPNPNQFRKEATYLVVLAAWQVRHTIVGIMIGPAAPTCPECCVYLKKSLLFFREVLFW
jgi:hypothetical protein